MLGLHFTPVCVLLLVCSLHFTLSLHFTPGPQSAVCSPQSAFYTDRFSNEGGVREYFPAGLKHGIRNPESGNGNGIRNQISMIEN